MPVHGPASKEALGGTAMSDALFVQGVMPSSLLSDSLLSDNLASFPRAHGDTRRAIDIEPSDAGDRPRRRGLAVGLLGAIIVAASLLAICFCFVPG